MAFSVRSTSTVSISRNRKPIMNLTKLSRCLFKLDDRRIVSGIALHSDCIRCKDCHKVIGDGAYKKHHEDICCINCYDLRHVINNSNINDSPSLLLNSEFNSSSSSIVNTTAISDLSSLAEITLSPKMATNNNSNRYRSLKSFPERVQLYNEYNHRQSSHLKIKEEDGKMIVCGSIRIYWNIHSPIQLMSGRSIPLGLYPKSMKIYDLNQQDSNDNDTITMGDYKQKNFDSSFKRLCFDDTALLTRLSLDDTNLRRTQTIKVPSSQRKTY
ncbi:unnamed protein product, partial [Didymodactylos carnosus]